MNKKYRCCFLALVNGVRNGMNVPFFVCISFLAVLLQLPCIYQISEIKYSLAEEESNICIQKYSKCYI